MIIEEKIIAEIKSNLGDGLSIVSICGAADLGKSYLSTQLMKSWVLQKINTNHLTLDSYLMDRAMRIEKGLSGYDIEAYSLMKAKKDLIKLKKRESI